MDWALAIVRASCIRETRQALTHKCVCVQSIFCCVSILELLSVCALNFMHRIQFSCRHSNWSNAIPFQMHFLSANLEQFKWIVRVGVNDLHLHSSTSKLKKENYFFLTLILLFINWRGRGRKMNTTNRNRVVCLGEIEPETYLHISESEILCNQLCLHQWQTPRIPIQLAFQR